jgi:hypothetical protein
MISLFRPLSAGGFGMTQLYLDVAWMDATRRAKVTSGPSAAFGGLGMTLG